MARFIDEKCARIHSSATLALLLFCAPSFARNPLETLPQAPLLPPFRWFASTDPKHRNDDFFLLKPGETRRIPLAAGQLERLWSTALFPDQLDLELEAGPARRQNLLSGGKAARGFFADKTFTFFPNFKGDALARLEKSAVLIVTNRAAQPNKWFFQAAVRPQSAPPTLPKPLETAQRTFQIALAPGENKVVENWTTPGEITEFSVASDAAGADFQKLRFKASFEGQKAVDAPLSSLAGQIVGEGKLQNAVADFNGSRLVLKWPMPFQSAQISLQNEGQKPLQLQIGARVSQFASAPSPFRFCALERAATPQNGHPVEILNLRGAGAFVGLALSLAPREGATRRTFAFLEGNETLLADGRKYEGTGTEDFFSSAWYFPDRPFSHDFEGLTQKIAAPPSVSAYRWMISDAVPFQKSFRFDFEHGNGNNAENIAWKWTAFWYQKSPLTLPATSAGNREVTSQWFLGSDPAQKQAENRRKIALAVGAGVILGVLSALSRRRRT